MIPETYQSVELKLYKCKQFPYKWNFVKNLLEGCFCDSTIFNINNNYYIFTRDAHCSLKAKKNGLKNDAKTYLFKTKDILNDDLILYKKNILPDGYRGGGNVFNMNNKLYIPIQTLTSKYGENLAIYEIIYDSDNIDFKFNTSCVDDTPQFCSVQKPSRYLTNEFLPKKSGYVA